MNALTEAIKQAYKRQSELITSQRAQIEIISTLQGKIDPWVAATVVDAIYTYYRRELEDINTVLIALEAVRDAE